jgi:predicted ATPase
VALDGHDAAGKTTLAHALAARIGGVYQRPFHGSLGTELLRAGERGDFDRVVALGEQAIGTALEGDGSGLPIVLDRSWMTVASLIEPDRLSAFFATWTKWIPTALCWADLPTTLQRLNRRSEPAEAMEMHQRYLAIYWDLANQSKSPMIRTDLYSEQSCLEFLVEWIYDSKRQDLISEGGPAAVDDGR